jgi:hypothetical protein
MLQVARLAPNLLQEAAEPVALFFREQFNQDGGARDRAGKSDLYYTVFALEGLIALRQELPVARVRPYLESFTDGEGLDFVHLTCLARCWAALGPGAIGGRRAPMIASRVEKAAADSLYHHFLRLGAMEDLGMTPAEPERDAASILRQQSPDGSFGGTTPTTAAAVAVTRHLGGQVPQGAVDWLLARARPAGGFLAVPDAPVPDLLSTATALHALAAAHAPLGALKEPMLDFVDTLWTGKGFCGSWADDVVDSEYTYYALLALGHLSLP